MRFTIAMAVASLATVSFASPQATQGNPLSFLFADPSTFAPSAKSEVFGAMKSAASTIVADPSFQAELSSVIATLPASEKPKNPVSDLVDMDSDLVFHTGTASPSVARWLSAAPSSGIIALDVALGNAVAAAGVAINDDTAMTAATATTTGTMATSSTDTTKTTASGTTTKTSAGGTSTKTTASTTSTSAGTSTGASTGGVGSKPTSGLVAAGAACIGILGAAIML